MTDIADRAAGLRAQAPDRPSPETTPQQVRALLSALMSVGRFRVQLAFALLVLGGFTEGLSILLLLPLLQLIATSKDGSHALDLGGHHILGVALPDISIGLGALLAIFAGLVTVQVVFNRAKSTFLSDLLIDFTNRVRLSLFGALSRARWDRITRIPASELEHALTGEVERISSSAFYLLSIAQAVVMLTIYLAMSLAISVPMTLIMLVFGVVALAAMRPFRRRADRFGELLQQARKQQFSTVTDFLSGLKIARVTNNEARFYSEFEQILRTNQSDARDYVRYTASGSGLFQLMITIGAAIYIYVAVTMMQMEFARLAVMLVVAMRIAPRFMALQAQLQQLLPDIAAWRHVRALESDLVQAEDNSVRTGIQIPPLQHAIVLDRVSYRHDTGARPALDQLSLTIPVGKVTALIGASGSGKSTVADLVTGLLRPGSGLLTFDERVLTPPELRGWRDHVSYVAQENFLLNLSIRENLQMMLPGPCEDSDLWGALDKAAASDFVRALPDGLETVIGNRGVRLSGGQRQRLALAQAFIRRPRFLVLDEATSALDWKMQDHVSAAVRDMARQGTTVLTIAHRPSMVAFADMVYALQDGHVVESGTATELRAHPQSRFSQMLRNEAAHPDTFDHEDCD